MTKAHEQTEALFLFVKTSVDEFQENGGAG